MTNENGATSTLWSCDLKWVFFIMDFSMAEWDLIHIIFCLLKSCDSTSLFKKKQTLNYPFKQQQCSLCGSHFCWRRKTLKVVSVAAKTPTPWLWLHFTFGPSVDTCCPTCCDRWAGPPVCWPAWVGRWWRKVSSWCRCVADLSSAPAGGR